MNVWSALALLLIEAQAQAPIKKVYFLEEQTTHSLSQSLESGAHFY